MTCNGISRPGSRFHPASSRFIMALSSFATASGQKSGPKAEAVERKLQKLRKKKKLLRCDDSARPLFVCEAELSKGGLFGGKAVDVLLVLFPDSIVLLCGGLFDGGEEAADDEKIKVLKLLAYPEVLEVQLSGASLELESVDAADRSRLASAQLLDLLTADPAAAAAGGSLLTATTSDSRSGLESAATADGSLHGSAAGGSAAAVPVTSTTLLFASPAKAREAAAAILFYRAQSEALDAWMAQGLHSGLVCQLAAVDALPLPSTARTSSTGGGTLWRAVSLAFGRSTRDNSSGGPGALRSVSYSRSASFLARGDTAAAKALLYSWCNRQKLRWGCSVPLPQGWGPLLDREAAAGHAAEGESVEITAEDLNSPCSLATGPQALLITFSTPLGLAQATITPQIARAALVNSDCRQVLAVPVPDGSSGGAQPLLPVSFQLRFSRDAAAAAAADDGSFVSGGAATPAAAAQAPGGPAASSGSPALSYVSDAYAALTVLLVRSPETAGRPAAERPLNPYPAASAQPQQQPAGLAAVQESAGEAAAGDARSLQAVRLALLALAASLLVPQFSRQPLVVLLQLLLLAAVALADVAAARQRPAAAAAAGGSRQQRQRSQAALQQANMAATPQRSLSAQGSKLSPASSGTSAFAAVATAPWEPSTQDDGLESPLGCGWSLVLAHGDLLASPGPFLQLQVAQLSCSDESAELRSQMTCLKELAEEEVVVQLPVLVSDPEPAWVTPDIKQRFINAKPTLPESVVIAQATHEWRVAERVDSVLQRPCPCFDAVQQVLPMYLLDRSPEGNAVLVMKGSGVRAMCDAIHRPTPGQPPVTTSDLQHYITLMNEYTFNVLAPNALPGGCLCQVYDLAGLQMKLVMGEGMGLFQVLLGLGQFYPERLHVALLINAPSWFSIVHKVVANFLHPNTRARMVVVGNPKDALQQLAHHLSGLENVPQEWGGACGRPLHEFPAHVAFVDHVRRVNAAAA